MIEFFLDPAFWATLAILVGLELALGVDNIVFVSLVMARVPQAQRDRARRIGLAISAIVQILLLFVMLWIAGVERTAFTIAGWSPSWSELAFLAGGVFLIYKAVSELHIHIEHGPRPVTSPPVPDTELSFAAVIAQVAVINAVFSVDTIITAVGITRSVEVIVIAILLTTVIIYFATGPISAFISRHKSVRGLALAFLLMIGGSLVSEGLGIRPDPVLLYAAIGVGALILAIVKLVERSQIQKIGEPAASQEREEPVLDPVVEAEPARDEDALEEPVPDVQQSTPKRRAPRRKSARKGRASPQG
jgi:predicted tellurium resistance membrane protein TerC